MFYLLEKTFEIRILYIIEMIVFLQKFFLYLLLFIIVYFFLDRKLVLFKNENKQINYNEMWKIKINFFLREFSLKKNFFILNVEKYFG